MKRWRKPGQGSVHRRPEVKRSTIAFDDETHEQIRARAEQAGVSFSEKARELVEWGLEAEQKAR